MPLLRLHSFHSYLVVTLNIGWGIHLSAVQRLSKQLSCGEKYFGTTEVSPAEESITFTDLLRLTNAMDHKFFEYNSLKTLFI